MDGTASRILVRSLLTALVVWLAGCSNLDPKPTPLPYSLYDSPLIAGSIPESDLERPIGSRQSTASSASNEASRSRRSDPPSSAGTHRDEPSRPALSSTKSAAEAGGADGLSKSEAESKTPNPAATADANGGARAHPDAARYVAAIYELNGVAIPGEAHRDIPSLYRHCRDENGTFQSREPAAGDMVFFHNVGDTNGDGRNNDWYSYVALVEKVDPAGTVTLLGYRDGQVRTFRMNRSHPDIATANGGDVINTQLRRKRPDDPPYTQYLAGQLFAGYCALLGDTSELLVVDNWQPGMQLE